MGPSRNPGPVDSPSPSPWLLLAALVAGTILLAAGHAGPTLLEPLPWDMSHHYLGALDLQRALDSGSPGAVLAQLRAADLYPPGHSLWLGIWLEVAGASPASWILFQLMTLWACLTALWFGTHGVLRGSAASTGFAVSATVLLMTVPAVGLAATFLIDLPAAAVLLMALAVLGRAPDRLLSKGGVAGVAALVAVLLMKYNVGLPLLPALGVMAAVLRMSGRRRAARTALATAGAGLTVWAGYLLWMDQGWPMFLDFARNRANTGDLGVLARLGLYVRIYAGSYLASPLLAAGVAVLAGLSLLRGRAALVPLAWAYLVFMLAALAGHPYVLQRNLLPVAVLLALLAGLGAGVLWDRLPASRGRAGRRLVRPGAAVAGLAVAAGLVTATLPDLKSYVAGRYAAQRDLAALSEQVENALAGRPRCRVLGTFEAFSTGWVRVLWNRTHPPGVGGLTFEPPVALDRTRTGIDPAPSDRYAAALAAAAHRQPDCPVITLAVDPESPLADEGYRTWSGWKDNLVQAMAGLEGYLLFSEKVYPDLGLTCRVYEPDDGDWAWGPGWGVPEPWGRWALDRTVAVRLDPQAPAGDLRIRVCAFEGMAAPQTVVVRAGRREVARFTLAGKPWRWQEFGVDLDGIEPPPATLTLAFSDLWPAFPGDPWRRAAPVSVLLPSGSTELTLE